MATETDRATNSATAGRRRPTRRAAGPGLLDAVAVGELLHLARRVAALNRDIGEVGAGMLASLVDEARAVLETVGQGSGGVPDPGSAAMDYDRNRIDEAVLALLAAHSFDGGRAWKGFDFDVLDRLRAAGLIESPVNRAKSLWLTEEGLASGRQLAQRLFGAPLPEGRTGS